MFDSAKKTGIECVFTHHEQAAAFAAGGYARIHGLGSAIFTTGPGGTNSITGVAAAWLDSIPIIYLGGQVRSNHIKPSNLRQLGVQELDVVGIISPIVKYAKTLMHPSEIRYELEKCLHFATSGRPGPVYLEIPLDLQWAEIEKDKLSAFVPEKTVASDDAQIHQVLNKLGQARRPLLLLGAGIRLAGALLELEQFLKKRAIPYVTTWNITDAVQWDDPLNLGRPGMFGNRAANIAIQTCDFLCCLGTHLSNAVTTPNYEQFAPKAEVALINIDPHVLEHQRVKIDYSLCSDALCFLQAAIASSEDSCIKEWQIKCKTLKLRFQDESIGSSEERALDAYGVLSQLNELFASDDIIVVDGGGTIVQIASQGVKLRKGQRFIIDSGLCAMGSGLPQAIGAAFVNRQRRVICLCGDGSLQFNIHELQTIFHHKLSVKMFIFNNDGYLSIRHTQMGFLGGDFAGSSQQGGMSLPDIAAVASAYKIPNQRVISPLQLQPAFRSTLTASGPALCEIMISSNQEVNPTIGFDEPFPGKFVARPIEDMKPFLGREELSQLLS